MMMMMMLVVVVNIVNWQPADALWKEPFADAFGN
jgi:hypothetical protein